MPETFEVDGIVFDIDGTLFDTRSVAIPSLKEGCRSLSEKYQINLSYPGDEKYISFIGQPSSELYRNLFPQEFHGYLEELREVVRQNELRLITSGKGKLFPGVREILSTLKDQGFRIGYYSNAGPSYFYTIIRTFGLDEFNIIARCYGETQLRKPALLRKIKEDANMVRISVVGDRKEDMIAAIENNDIAIGARYGFGGDELRGYAHAFITSITELPDLLAPATSSRSH
jgi:phosphoglycolate phosphatase